MWPRRAAVAAAFALGAMACSRKASAPDSFPIGLYNVFDPGPLARLKEDGFDAFVAAPDRSEGFTALSRSARSLGMTMIASPRSLLDGRADPKTWPLLAWYLQDEPDVNRVSPEALRAFSAQVAAKDGRPQTFVIGSADAAPAYASIGDALMLDWYPVPHLPLDSVADQIDKTLEALAPGKPLWFVVQAFDWREEVQQDPKKPRVGRFPEETEIRFMSYLAVMHGARGLFYFRLVRPDGKSLLELPELWTRVSRVTREMSLLKPIFADGTLATLPFVPDPIAGPEARCWRYRGRRYVVLANRDALKRALVPDELLKSRWRPLFQMRRDPREALVGDGSKWFLKPHQVMVFEGPWRPFAR